MVIFSLVVISCSNKKTNVEKTDDKKVVLVKNNTKIKELQSQVFHSVLYQNEYFYFLGKKGDFEDVTLNFNVKRLINDATIDNIFYSDEANPNQNQLYRIKDHTNKDNLNYEIVVFDEWEDKDAKIKFSLVNKKDDVWKFQYIPSSPWKQENSKRTYSQNLDLREEYLFINQKNIDSLIVLTKGLWSKEEDNDENLDTVCYKKPYYFKLKEKYKYWKNYNPIRFVSSKSKISIYTQPDTTSKVVSKLKYNDWVIVNDTVNKQSNNNNLWLDIYDRVSFRKGYILNKNLAQKPTYENLPVK
ncbi:hypothetical protein [Flavobacterium pectinovorum]|uniref:SH3 domain-containing protein n=1 Tax=Flavobacterium pectinovorum TaxID=29533 RepID=A0A502EXW7_9FLAO|nr:hypothetical protein [Flavobacterium pectinovorum]TPG41962.1 hypothetical protein EAH81_06470 [Flavobacterium pectinovorum]